VNKLNDESFDCTPEKIMIEISCYYKARIRNISDIDGNICVFIDGLDRLKKRRFLSNLEGRGKDYHEACIDYINNLMDKNYLIRYKKKIYATSPLRKIVRSNDIFMSKYLKKEDYLCGKNINGTLQSSQEFQSHIQSNS
jgi:hypothetical protein